jgi:hypothetical protein
MTHAECAKFVCEGAAAIAALVAAHAWRAAASKPAANPGPGFYASGDPNDSTMQAVLTAGQAIDRGAALNRRAAMWAGISAFFQAWALLVPYFWNWFIK